MSKYTFEDIEILRQKSGISYEEAVNLLEYHNGSLARALVDLEKNGRLKTGTPSGDEHKNIKGAFNFLYRLRLKVRKDEAVVVNLSSLFVILALITAPYLVIIGLIVCLVLGYRINIDRNSREFSSDTFDSMVKNAKDNVQHTVSSFAQQFSQGAGKENKTGGDAAQDRPAPPPRTESAASGTRPVNVQFPDGGSVDVRDDGDGYHEADIR